MGTVDLADLGFLRHLHFRPGVSVCCASGDDVFDASLLNRTTATKTTTTTKTIEREHAGVCAGDGGGIPLWYCYSTKTRKVAVAVAKTFGRVFCKFTHSDKVSWLVGWRVN